MSGFYSSRCTAALSKSSTRPILCSNRRLLSTSSVRLSYIGSTPIVIPPDITIERVSLSKPRENATSKKDDVKQEERLIVRGKSGETSAASASTSTAPEKDGEKEFKSKRRNPACPPIATNEAFSLSGASAGSPRELTLFVESPDDKQQRQLWGTTRTLIANAVQGQGEGYMVPLYLIGVGYRAALEEDQLSLAAMQSASKASPASSIASENPAIVETVSYDQYPRRRLALRLGYSHVIYLMIPQDIRVTVPSPTIIQLWGRDKQKVAQFAANIRSLREPEVYKGKGVFVGDEKIKMKVGKKK